MMLFWNLKNLFLLVLFTMHKDCLGAFISTLRLRYCQILVSHAFTALVFMQYHIFFYYAFVSSDCSRNKTTRFHKYLVFSFFQNFWFRQNHFHCSHRTLSSFRRNMWKLCQVSSCLRGCFWLVMCFLNHRWRFVASPHHREK